MKKFITFFVFAFAILANTTLLKAQCTFISPTVEISNITTNVGGNCEVTMNLAFDLVTNSGNKIVFIHLWKQSQYPNLSYSTNQSQPTAANLSNALANFVIDNNNALPAFLSTYGPANSVIVKTPVNNPGLTIIRTTSATLGAERFIISNVKVIIPGACTNSFSFQGDAWSSNSNSNNPVVHCAMAGFIVGGTDPALTASRNCASYTMNVTTISTTKSIYYDVYMDNGDGIFNPSTDILINAVSSSNAITVTPSSAYNPGPVLLAAPYNSAPYTNRKMYFALSSVGQSFIGLTEVVNTTSCGLAPITLSSFYATRKNSTSVLLSWKTETEINAKGFDIERKTDNGYIKIAHVAASNNANGDVYSYQDNNSSKNISLYRIKLVDKNGSTKLSEVRSVKGNGAASDFTVFPNPSNGNSKVSITDLNENNEIQVLDYNGRVVKKMAITNTNAIDLTNLQKGLYLVKIVNTVTGEMVTKKLTVLQ